jgi:hypothetical protein
MLTAILLVFAGVMSRLVLPPLNLVPLGAIALYAGARLPRKWAMTIPLAILLLSDLVLDHAHGYAFHPSSRLTTYAFFSAMALWSTFVPRNAGALTRVGMSLTASSGFFLVSNFVVWAERSGYSFPLTFAGLLSTYGVAIPFYRNNLAADLVGTAVLFGAHALVTRLAARREPVRELAS